MRASEKADELAKIRWLARELVELIELALWQEAECKAASELEALRTDGKERSVPTEGPKTESAL